MRDLLVEAPPGWPEVGLTWGPLPDGGAPLFLGENAAGLPLLGGDATFDRVRREVRFRQPGPPDGHNLAHPCLAAAGSVFAWWDGRLAFHGGGVTINGSAWGVLGTRGAGKSTLLAHLARRGRGVLADDLLTTDGGQVFAGPRSIDLRAPSADRFGTEAALLHVRMGQRRRLVLPPIDAAVLLGGFLVLGVGDRMSVRRVAATARLQILASYLTVRHESTPPVALLDLCAKPMWRVERTDDWDELPQLLRHLEDAIGSSAFGYG